MDGDDQLSMFSSAEHPAKHSVSPDSEADWLTRVATSRLGFLQFLSDFAPAGSSGKMSPEHFRQLTTSRQIHVSRTFEWKQDESTKKPIPTLLTSDTHSDVSWPDFKNSGMGSPTELLTLSTSEFPSVVVESSLLDILQETGTVPLRFYLSAKACAGILRRAAKRGRELPERLRLALEAGAAQMAETDDATNS